MMDCKWLAYYLTGLHSGVEGRERILEDHLNLFPEGGTLGFVHIGKWSSAESDLAARRGHQAHEQPPQG